MISFFLKPKSDRLIEQLNVVRKKIEQNAEKRRLLNHDIPSLENDAMSVLAHGMAGLMQSSGARLAVFCLGNITVEARVNSNEVRA